MRNILCNILYQPIPILVAEVWRRNLEYVKILQAKYFTGKNIPIYGNLMYNMQVKKHSEVSVQICGTTEACIATLRHLCYI